MTADEFVRREASLPPYPGACCRIVDRWITEVTGFSALSRFGRDFNTQEEAQAWLDEGYGMVVAVNRVMRACGYPKTKEPRVGDVGLAIHNGRFCMAILATFGWVSRDDSGMICVPTKAYWKAWRIAQADN